MPKLGQESIARNEAGRLEEIQFGWSGAGRCAGAGPRFHDYRRAAVQSRYPQI